MLPLKFTIFLIFLSLIKFSEQKTNVTVLYEALCGDSENFINQQLVPNYDSVKDLISVELVPYGKASHTPGVNTWKFTCQHGDRECKLNKYHACGIKYAPSELAQIKYASCLIKETLASLLATRDDPITESCARDAGVDYGKIRTCSTGSEADILLAGHGDRTNRLAPNIEFVPTIIFNGVFDKYNHNWSLTQFVNVINYLCGSTTYQQLIQPYDQCNYCYQAQPYSYGYYK